MSMLNVDQSAAIDKAIALELPKQRVAGSSPAGPIGIHFCESLSCGSYGVSLEMLKSLLNASFGYMATPLNLAHQHSPLHGGDAEIG